MAAEARPAPWSNMYMPSTRAAYTFPKKGEWVKGKRTYTYKRNGNENTYEAVTYTYKGKKPKMRRLTSRATGEPYLMPEDDYAHLNTFMQLQQEKLSDFYQSYDKAAHRTGIARNALTPSDLVDYVFSGKHELNIEAFEMSEGHIAGMKYNAYYQLLEVTFRDGDNNVCVFFQVSPYEWHEFTSLADPSKKRISPVDGKERHILGMVFWDLIRIRGTKHGTRKHWMYTSASEATGNTPASPAPVERQERLAGKQKSGAPIDRANKLLDEMIAKYPADKSTLNYLLKQYSGAPDMEGEPRKMTEQQLAQFEGVLKSWSQGDY